MSELTLLDVFDNVFSKTRFDAALALKLYRFQVGYVNKNESHMAFLAVT